ncbi:tRNA preQ1(34) S-adenosylmethionine ribosyltransferase-isomerase QueA [Stenoxybacter acetivorans]|uniref:tRNA preQ1(34) S-adenosylmethionine ribosyltransferase-isomerase QueA n=1 Tax=Stenoxybacter acetivorans TaxID=422441 RepID=UPI000569D296|nr:tRNA preQ1(34) S-adenosylmethionine ribosyltransferase-isomerase QueA [Stenoxybacter acetivorans]
MHINDFDFNLPPQLIAQQPSTERGGSRLLAALPQQPLADRWFRDLADYVNAGDVLVFNNTKVMKARLFGQKESGGKIEVLVERVIDAHTALAHIRASKSPKPNTRLWFDGGIQAAMTERRGELFCLHFFGEEDVWSLLERIGHMPLPPYIEREADDTDNARYQTVYAKHEGAVAAPTAGLHFTDHLLQRLRGKGAVLREITLHVGAGTFQPVRVNNIAEHKMHNEWYEVGEDTVDAIETAKQSGKRVWAVGTTAMRALESAALSGSLKAGRGDTNIFITPGYSFKTADRLITNFHLPKSTLLMLVSAFSGVDEIRAVYQHAIAAQYRFFSYGDAMILGRKDEYGI